MLPDYKRPFEQKDYRGHFIWTKQLCKKLGVNSFYHACHQEELEEILNTGELNLRSKWGIELPIGSWQAPGVWVGLNDYYNNHYGPFRIKFRLEELIGKSFIAFRRSGDKSRYFFVQYEAQIPIFIKNGSQQMLNKITPKSYFEELDGVYCLKTDAVYDIILTNPISIHRAVIEPVTHQNKCIPQKCLGQTTKVQARRTLIEIAKNELNDRIRESVFIERFIKQFPDMEGRKAEIELPELD
ncbi:hypothetical protein [Paenibacillus paeoniae]|uniref:Uncharacterized protein n=1 Tax=Paenibacillus paeoniae TaxID=2292705 RepID=A0A371P276_9BACL|nr:hypothetical protein [Paenibacillus paeoniae]REK69426.1 hypothetical protein DX130_25075 [Paenibacillus paeoniae]